jgi:dipeptidyl aminopeptidase/acylaminoacyl peptidase
VRYSPSATRIYVTALAGSKAVALTVATSDGGREDGPKWSPDGRWILFRRDTRLMKALASGGTVPTLIFDGIADSTLQSEGSGQWLPRSSGIIYKASDGLRARMEDGGAERLVTGERPMLWDLSRDGRTIYAIVERERRAMELVTIDMATGAIRTLQSLGRRPLSPDYNGYWDTVRALRLSPDGRRLMYAHLNPSADIWILEGLGNRTP